VPRSRSLPSWLPGFALAAAAIIVVAVGLGLLPRPRQHDVLAEITDLHVSTLASANPVDVISTDRHTVKPWFQGKLPFTFDLPELQGSQFTLVGGRLVYLAHEPGAHLIYNVRSHHISVFILQDRPELDLSLRSNESLASVLSFHV